MRLIVTYWYRPWWGLGLIWRWKQIELVKREANLEETWVFARQFRAAGADVRVEAL